MAAGVDMLGRDSEYSDKAGFQVHNSLVYWVNRLAGAMRESFNLALKEVDVSWPQWLALNTLYHGQVETPAQIADFVGVDRSAVTRLLDRLADKGLVVREHDHGDRRSVKVRLTQSGRLKMRRIDELAKAHQASFLSHLPPTEVRAFKGNLQKLLRAGGLESNTLWRNLD